MYKVTPKIVDDLVKVIDQGLSYGLGSPKPGQMCVEAAICYIHGWEHNDRPSCVDLTLRSISINLNDNYPMLGVVANRRAAALKRLAIAQLGTFLNDNESRIKFEESFMDEMLFLYFQKWIPKYLESMVFVNNPTEEEVKIFQTIATNLRKAQSIDQIKDVVRSNEVHLYTFSIKQLIDAIESNFEIHPLTMVEQQKNMNLLLRGMNLISRKQLVDNYNQTIEDIVQVLINLKTEGSKWLDDVAAPEGVEVCQRM